MQCGISDPFGVLVPFHYSLEYFNILVVVVISVVSPGDDTLRAFAYAPELQKASNKVILHTD